MKSEIFSFSALLAASLMTTACATRGKPQKQPNIVFIMSDDHSWQTISAYGGRFKDIALTTNIDRIAKEGILFNRCLVTNSLSGPSRATILTGKYSHLNGFRKNGDKFDGSQQTFPKLLQKAGYQTAIIGKWHLETDPTGFDHWDILPGQGHYYNPDFINQNGRYQEHGYVTEIIANKSIEWLKKAKKDGKPFLLMMHNKAPHREWEALPEYLHKFDGIKFPEPESLFDNYSGRGKAAHEQRMEIRRDMLLDSDLKMWEDTLSANYRRTYARMDMKQRKEWDAYYNPIKQELDKLNPHGDDLVRWKYQRYLTDYLACIRSIDDNVGKVLDYLKKAGLDRNTIVVYTSDQGFFMGEHGWFDKRWMYEESYRTPLLISWSGVTKPGGICNKIVTNLDIAETFLDAAGVSVPEDMQGRSLVPVLKGDTLLNWREDHYYHYFEYPAVHSVKRHYGISTERYKLIHFYYDIDEWEMYDLKTDRQEMHNVYNDSTYAKIKDSLLVRLKIMRDDLKDSDDINIKKFNP